MKDNQMKKTINKNNDMIIFNSDMRKTFVISFSYNFINFH